MRIDHDKTEIGEETPLDLVSKTINDQVKTIQYGPRYLDNYKWVETIKKGNFHVMIGIPSRNEQCYVGFAKSLAETVAAMVASGVEVTVEQVKNSCFVAMSRNMLLKKFMDSKATHMLMIDDDMGWSRYAPLKMLAEGKDFIAGAGPVKGEKRFAADMIEKEGNLVTVREIGGAFILLSRNMVKRMVEEYKHLSHPVFDDFPHLFEDKYTKNQWIGEDYVFCERWREIGGEVYCYPDIDFEHLGNKVLTGNYKNHIEESKCV